MVAIDSAWGEPGSEVISCNYMKYEGKLYKISNKVTNLLQAATGNELATSLGIVG